MQTQDYHIIDKFRQMVEKRYVFSDLKNRFEIPNTINETIVNEIKDYFLSTIYPVAKERKELEDAFKELATYVKQPKKIWGLFGNMTGAIFKFGRHFMQALKAAFSSLDSFVGAKKFETDMAAIANKNGILPNMTDEEFEECLYQLPREDVEKFIEDVKSLFAAMVNTVLLEKTIAILSNVIETMERKSHTYPKADVDGIKLGRTLLQRGYAIFSKYDEPTKLAIVDFIYKNEMWFVESVYLKYENK